MEVRQMATAFLFHGSEALMMRKQGSQLYAGEFWSGLGGHLEPEELNAPRQAVLREIREESGITADGIEDLRLRYVLLRIKEDEIRQQFVYFGSAVTRTFSASDEGELFWIGSSKLTELRTSRIIHHMLRHYADHPHLDCVTVGTITIDGSGEVQMHWSALKDPLVF